MTTTSATRTRTGGSCSAGEGRRNTWSTEATCPGRAWGRLAPWRRDAPLVLGFSLLMASANASAQTWGDLLQKVRDAQQKDQPGADVVARENSTAPDAATAVSGGASPDPGFPGPNAAHTASGPARPPAESSSPDDTASAKDRRSAVSEPVWARPSRPIPAPSAGCYEELAFIGADPWILERPEFHFRHVFRFIDRPPYYRCVGPATIAAKGGASSASVYPDDVGPGRGESAYLFFGDSLPADRANGMQDVRLRLGDIRSARVAASFGDDVVILEPSGSPSSTARETTTQVAGTEPTQRIFCQWRVPSRARDTIWADYPEMQGAIDLMNGGAFSGLIDYAMFPSQGYLDPRGIATSSVRKIIWAGTSNGTMQYCRRSCSGPSSSTRAQRR